MQLENNVPYKVYREYDISNIEKRLDELDEGLWVMDISRQAYGHGPHNKTNSIILNYCRGEPEVDKQRALELNEIKEKNPDDEDLWSKFIGKTPGPDHGTRVFKTRSEEDFAEDVKNIEKRVVDQELNSYTDTIVKELEKKFNGIAGLVLFVRLPAHEVIPPHVDRTHYLSVVHRLHIPIKTNSGVEFTFDRSVVNMKKGYLYEINNKIRHGVKNLGDTDRIHLIVDIIPNSQLPP